MNVQKASTTAARMHPVSIPLDLSIAPVIRGSLAMDDYVQVQFSVLFIFLDYCVEVILKFSFQEKKQLAIPVVEPVNLILVQMV